MKPYDNMVTFESMFVGFAETLNRLDDAGADVILAFNVVFEALTWAVALDERVGEHWVPDGTPLRRDWRARLGLSARTTSPSAAVRTIALVLQPAPERTSATATTE